MLALVAPKLLYRRNDNKIDGDEKEELGKFLIQVGIRYSMLFVADTSFYIYDDDSTALKLSKDPYLNYPGCNDQLYWTQTWDGCFENKYTGTRLSYSIV